MRIHLIVDARGGPLEVRITQLYDYRTTEVNHWGLRDRFPAGPSFHIVLRVVPAKQSAAQLTLGVRGAAAT
jgi:hypothetical protein